MTTAGGKQPDNRLYDLVLFRHKADNQPRALRRDWADFARFLLDSFETSPCTVAAGPNKCQGK